PLPAPPQMRPAFLMAAAVVVLIGFIVFLGSSAGPGGGPRPGGPRPGVKPGEPAVAPESPSAKPGLAVAPRKTPATTPAAGTPAEPDWCTPQNARELADYLEKNPVARVALDHNLDLTAEGTQGLVFRGRDLEIKAADRKTRPTLRLDYPLGVRPHW